MSHISFESTNQGKRGWTELEKSTICIKGVQMSPKEYALLRGVHLRPMAELVQCFILRNCPRIISLTHIHKFWGLTPSRTKDKNLKLFIKSLE